MSTHWSWKDYCPLSPKSVTFVILLHIVCMLFCKPTVFYICIVIQLLANRSRPEHNGAEWHCVRTYAPLDFIVFHQMGPSSRWKAPLTSSEVFWNLGEELGSNILCQLEEEHLFFAWFLNILTLSLIRVLVRWKNFSHLTYQSLK